MSPVSVETDSRESRSRLAPTKLLASAHSCVQRLELTLDGLGGASNLLLLTGVGASLVASCLTGMMMDRSASPTPIDGPSNKASSALAIKGAALRVNL